MSHARQAGKPALTKKGTGAILVSDAVSLCGLPPGEYTVAGSAGRVVLTPEGRLYLAENDKLLAGSHAAFEGHSSHLVSRGLAGLAEAWTWRR